MKKKKIIKTNDKVNALTPLQVTSIAITTVVILSLWILNWVLLGDKIPANGMNDRGTFGDMFGAVNALFSGLAFGGIIWTILLQRNELKLQREESRESRKEAVEQNKTLRAQRFEHTFFNMLNLQNEIIKNLQTSTGKGRKVIQDAKNSLTSFLSLSNLKEIAGSLDWGFYRNETWEGHSITTFHAGGVLKDFYHQEFYDQYSSHFNHYFRHLYHIFKFIYFSKLEVGEKKFYATLARASLSQDELYLIAFNGLIDGYGNPNFLYLIKEYDILQNFVRAEVQPDIFINLIDEKLASVIYPFNETKPTDVNF